MQKNEKRIITNFKRIIKTLIRRIIKIYLVMLNIFLTFVET